MSILYSCQNDAQHLIENQLRHALAEETFYVYSDSFSPSDIEFAVIFEPPDGFFDGLNNLQAIFSIAAGVDHVLNHPGLSGGVPIVRLLDAGMGEKMAEYVLYGVLHAQRNFTAYRDAQQQRIWAHDAGTVHAAQFHVGILGLGTLGCCVAERLTANGYKVSGWTRQPKSVENVQTYAGVSELDRFMRNLNVLVCLLPLTAETKHVLNKTLFSKAPRGLFLINLARGAHVVDQDLMDALQNGQISGALLDVTDPEPPPTEHPFWNERRIILTPHIAGPTQEMETVEQIANNIKRYRNGEPLQGLVDHSKGY